MSKIINIPFQGFYESLFSDELDNVQDQFVEYEVEKNTGLDPRELHDAIYKSADYGKAFDYIARRYVDYFNDYLKTEYELDLDLKFESMQSPEEYNFTTDRIFCFISEENVRKLRAFVAEDELRLAIKTRFTSRSGFISSYSNDLEGWNRDPTTWDYNELGTLLVALLSDSEGYDRDIFEDMLDHNVFDTAFDQCVDWEAYDAFLKEEA